MTGGTVTRKCHYTLSLTCLKSTSLYPLVGASRVPEVRFISMLVFGSCCDYL